MAFIGTNSFLRDTRLKKIPHLFQFQRGCMKTRVAIDCALATPAIGSAIVAHVAQLHDYITLSNAASLFAIIYSGVATIIAILRYKKNG